MDKLRECPFCGREEKVFMNQYSKQSVSCHNIKCPIHGRCMTPEQWNTRHEPAEYVKPEEEAMKPCYKLGMLISGWHLKGYIDNSNYTEAMELLSEEENQWNTRQDGK